MAFPSTFSWYPSSLLKGHRITVFEIESPSNNCHVFCRNRPQICAACTDQLLGNEVNNLGLRLHRKELYDTTYRVAHMVADWLMLVSNLKFHFSIRSFYCEQTLNLMSTRASPQPDVSPCSEKAPIAHGTRDSDLIAVKV